MEIKINKCYINIKDDFLKKLKELYDLEENNENTKINGIIVIKNYINSVELENILNLKIIYCNISNIIKLNLTANEIEVIPKSLDNFVQLKNLNLNNNKITKIENLEKLINLEKLELRSNKISKIENLETLQSLKHLTLSSNLITAIDKNDLPNIKNLEELGLFGNYLGIENTECLKELDLKNEELLKELIYNIKVKYPCLTSIYIGGNYFTFNNDYINIIYKIHDNIKLVDGNNK